MLTAGARSPLGLKLPKIVATYVYASSQGQRTHSARTNSGLPKLLRWHTHFARTNKLLCWRTHFAWTNFNTSQLEIKEMLEVIVIQLQ